MYISFSIVYMKRVRDFESCMIFAAYQVFNRLWFSKFLFGFIVFVQTYYESELYIVSKYTPKRLHDRYCYKTSEIGKQNSIRYLDVSCM